MNVLSQSQYQRRGKTNVPDSEKDEKYYERRRRNNEAAKKSRDARRVREDFIELRLKILESENGILQRRIILLCQEIESLHTFILEMQRQIPEMFNRTLRPNITSMQATSLRTSQLCCIRNFDAVVASNPIAVRTASNTTATSGGVIAWRTSISHL